MSQDDIADKIRKILRRADESRNDSDAEREVAMRKAQALLMEHGLSMADLGELDDEALPEGRAFGTDHAFVTARTESWRGKLLASIAAVYFAKVYFTRRSHSRVWTILGRQDHVRTALVMFEWVEPQLQIEFDRQVSRMGSYQRLARKYALLVMGVPLHMIDYPLSDTSDEELAAMGANHFEHIKAAQGADAALWDIQRVLGVSENYARHVRVHIRKHDIAPTVAKDLASWRDTWFDYAISTIRHRLEKIQKEEAEKFGSRGTDLVVNENQALQVFMDEIGLKLSSQPKKSVMNPQAAEAGAAAGAAADLRPGHRVEDGGPIALGAGD